MLTINDIQTGDYFKYQSKRWQTVEKYFYKWNEDGTISTEFKILSKSGEVKYLEIDTNENIISISKKIRYKDLQGESGSSIVSYKDIDYTLEKEHAGIYWAETSKWEKEAFNVWDYFDDTRKKWISVEEWDDDEFEVYVGSIIDPSEISNIQKGEPPPKLPKLNLSASGAFKTIFLLTFSSFAIISLFNKQSNTKPASDPLTILINKLDNQTAVVLNDMKYDESAPNKYTHQYKIIFKDQDSIKSKTTDFINVNPQNFLSRKDDMSMEVASKKQNEINLIARPPGYGIYIGNTAYGNWNNDNFTTQDTTWEFKSQYATLNDFYNFDERPVNYIQWSAYQRLPSKNSAFYGTNNEYTTDAYLQTETGKKSNWGLTPLAKREEAIRQAKVDQEKIVAARRQRIYRTNNRYSSSSRRSSSRSSGGK